jgi:hypothetical protein
MSFYYETGTAMKYQAEWRIASAIYFTVAGSILISSLSLGAPSQWYVLYAWLFAGSAIAWAWRPTVAAVISIGPVVGLAFFLQYCKSSGDLVFLGVVLGIALIFIVTTLHSYPIRNTGSR